MKKNKKGFTLIELLAIIVILAVIAVITVPIILNIIENSKKGAATNSALGYKEAIQKYYASKLFEDNNFKLQGEFDIDNQGAISNELEEYQIAFSGTTPSGGYATIENGKLISGCVQINEYAVRFEEGSVSETKKGNCGPVLAEAFPQVTDNNPGIICGNGETEDYDNSSVCYIYSVEDLVAFSSMVNSGKNFSGKTVQLMNNLDIENDKSYLNPNSNSFGDVNENSTTSATLKEELTDETAKGFKSIGNYSNAFAGTFEGNTKTIKNLYINRPSETYVGLFGWNNGTIKGLQVISADITGNENIGIIAGYNNGNITSTIVNGNISGVKIMGLITAESNSGKTVEAIASGHVRATSTSGPSVGGLVGYNSGTINGIYKSGSVTTGEPGTSRTHRTVGYKDYGSITTGALNTITVNESTVISGSSAAEDGYDIPANAINNIAMMEAMIDTYIGGDNNNDGYYYDYDSNGEFTIYSTSDHPLTITMAKDGDYYIINSYDELKQVSYLGTNGTGKYYKLNIDIDLTNKNPIMLGSASSTNHFAGTFDGNGHTIKKLDLKGHQFVGLFGYNDGTIKGLNVTQANITALEHMGIIAGDNNGNITNMVVDGTVTGVQVMGLVVGENYSGKTVEAIASGIVDSTSTWGPSVGGLVGYNAGTINGIYKSGSVTTGEAGTSRTHRTVGYKDYGSITTGALNTITVNGSTSSSTSISSEDGKSYTASELQTLTPYAETGLNTTTTGEYRYALDSNNNPYIVKN